MTICCMVGCSLRSDRDRASFFRFPRIKKHSTAQEKELILLRRALWLTRVGRKDLMRDEHKLEYARICGRHFVKGEPSSINDIKDPDWAPSILLGHDFLSDKTDTDYQPLRRGRKKKNTSQLKSKARPPIKSPKRMKFQDSSSESSRDSTDFFHKLLKRDPPFKNTSEKQNTSETSVKVKEEDARDPSVMSLEEKAFAENLLLSLNVQITALEKDDSLAHPEALEKLVKTCDIQDWLEALDEVEVSQSEDEEDETNYLVPLQKPEPIIKTEDTSPVTIIYLKKEIS